MTLPLDARQRAMLEEMGIRLFWPPAPLAGDAVVARAPRAEAVRAAPAQATQATQPVQAVQPVQPRNEATQARTEPAPARRSPVAEPAPAPARAPAAPRFHDAAIASLDWDGLQQAVASRCEGRRSIFGTGDRQPDLLVVGDPPTEAEELEGQPFAGDAGRLLANMLAALGLSRERGAYLTNVVKCRPAGGRNPEPDEIAQDETILRRQVQLLRPKVIVVMGRFVAPTLLQTTEPVGRLRGRLHAYEGVPTVVTYPPAYLLRNLPEKARAWADLCLARPLLLG